MAPPLLFIAAAAGALMLLLGRQQPRASNGCPLDAHMTQADVAELNVLLANTNPEHLEGAAAVYEADGYPMAADCLLEQANALYQAMGGGVVDKPPKQPQGDPADEYWLIIEYGHTPAGVAVHYTGDPSRYAELDDDPRNAATLGAWDPQLFGTPEAPIGGWPGWRPGAEIVVPAGWSPHAKGPPPTAKAPPVVPPGAPGVPPEVPPELPQEPGDPWEWDDPGSWWVWD